MTELDPQLNALPPTMNKNPAGAKVHLVGIGGVAMAALAGLLAEAGCRVTGSDGEVYPPVSDLLRAMNISPAKGYGPETLPPDCDLAIIGNVVTRQFPVLERLRELKKPYLSLPQTLKKLFLNKTRNLVVAGCHGKTTTTALAAHIWNTAGLAPGFLIGGSSLDFPHPWQRAETGRDQSEPPWFIIEGDEYDSAFFNKAPKFLHYRPHTVILTSIEFDHADIYPDLQAVVAAFTELAKIIPAEGRLIAHGDDPLVRQVAAKAKCGVEFYGLGVDNDWRVTGFEAEDGPGGNEAPTRLGHSNAAAAEQSPSGAWRSAFELSGPEGFYARLSWARPGVYNALNAAAAIAAFVGDGGDGRWPAEALRSFKGPKRRQEVLGIFNGVELVDDFAHHPTAVAETLRATRAARPGRRILAAFEPRSNTSRRAVFQKDYAAALAGADLVFLRRTPDPQKAPEGDRLDIDRLAADLAPRAQVFDDGLTLGRALAAEAREGDLAVVMSNGGFDGLTDFLRNNL